MTTVRITKRVVDAAQPRDVDHTIWDSEVRGFGLRVRPSGAKSFIVRYRAGSSRKAPIRRYTIGPGPVRTIIERGPKGKRSVAFGIDWPGWSRGARSAELAVATLESYRERYRPVAGLAGMAREFDAAGPLEIVEDRIGTGSTDFWGISFSPCSTEHGPMGEAELERGITLLRACWVFFDTVGAMTPTCAPFSTACSAASAATIVLPLPTSPWSRRCMG